MEALKIIPQVFFDLIARVVPGSVGIVVYLLFCGITWDTTISYSFGPSFAQGSITLSFLIFLGTGYVIGELISPIAKMVQRITETNGSILITWLKALGTIWKKGKKEEEKTSSNKQPEIESPEFKEAKIRYDRLRLKHPEVGALCAKIRAEFTMHNGLAFVFAISALFYPFSVLPFHWYALSFLLLMIILTAHRGRTTNKTFNETVAKFTQVLNE